MPLKDGFEYWDDVLSVEQINTVKSEINNLEQEIPRYGIRHADKLLPSVNKLAHSEKLLQKAQEILGENPSLVRAIIFDKSPDKNWFVPWHQDRTVPVNKKFNAEGWTNWTVKREVLHAEAPEAVLKQMITFRIHLDDAYPENGGLKFIPGSHHRKLTAEEATKLTAGEYQNSLRKAGNAFIMKPLLLHSSNKSSVPDGRQVIQLEYSCYILPQDVSWA